MTAAVMMLGVSGCGNTQEQTAEQSAAEAVKERTTKAAPENNDLVIPVSEVSETAKFYPVTVEGTDMEVFAVKDSSGNIKTAFNTCQSCYTSGNGRYELEGTDLVCQNCGFHFTADQIGQGANGGCSPWAISADERTDGEDTITISYDFLVSSNNIFANWK
ncbi:MAG: DUF2318 domain-containing protein [Ruminococcus sp.]|nr:DUF2318 domain-containing protein [Ruminococcus sp.]